MEKKTSHPSHSLNKLFHWLFSLCQRRIRNVMSSSMYWSFPNSFLLSAVETKPPMSLMTALIWQGINPELLFTSKFYLRISSLTLFHRLRSWEICLEMTQCLLPYKVMKSFLMRDLMLTFKVSWKKSEISQKLINAIVICCPVISCLVMVYFRKSII